MSLEGTNRAHIVSVWAAPRPLGWLPFQGALRETVGRLWACRSSQEAASAVRRWYVPVRIFLLSYLPACGRHIPEKLQPFLQAVGTAVVTDPSPA